MLRLGKSWDEVLVRPKGTWLVHNLIREGGFAVLAGEPGGGKSLLSLDLMLTLATEGTKDWYGRRIRNLMPERVAYIFGESSAGLADRAKGWMQERGLEPNGDYMYFYTHEKVQLDRSTDDHLQQLVEDMNEFDPSFIVVDTMAATMSGEENSSQQTQDYIRGLQRLQTRPDGSKRSVLVVHHVLKGDKTKYRGSSALLGAVDTMLVLVKEAKADHVALVVDKQKDGPPIRKLTFRKRSFDLPEVDPDFGTPYTSVILELVPEEELEVGNTEADESVVEALKAIGGDGTSSEVFQILVASDAGLNPATVTSRLDRASKKGHVIKTSEKRGRAIVWRLSEEPEVL